MKNNNLTEMKFMKNLLNDKNIFCAPLGVLLIFIFLLPIGIYSQTKEIIFDGTGTLTRDIVKSKLSTSNLQSNEEWNATIRGYTAIGDMAFTPFEFISTPNNPLTTDTIRLMFNLVSIIIENGCETIGTSAFAELPLLQTVNIQSNLKILGTRTFFKDSALINITLPETITTMKEQAFEACVNLELSELPANLTTLAPKVFSNCRKISISKMPKNIDTVSAVCFQSCDSITEFTLHENIKHISIGAFYMCKNLKTIICLMDFVPTIEQNSFARQHPDKVLYVKEKVRPNYFKADGTCYPFSCWLYSALGEFKDKTILILPTQIEVIVEANDDNLGNIEIKSDADINNLQVDDKLELTAIPNSAGCCRFVCWKDETTGNIISKYKKIIHIVKAATKLVAVFE